MEEQSNVALFNKCFMKYYCDKCKGTTHDSYECENPSCPNQPCCGKPLELCDCNNQSEIEVVILYADCINCKKHIEIPVKVIEWNNYQSGIHLQNAFPKLSTDKREFIHSQVCGDCWNNMFPPEDTDFDDGSFIEDDYDEIGEDWNNGEFYK